MSTASEEEEEKERKREERKGGEDAQRRKSNNPNLKGFLSCMNLYHIHIVRMQCFARCMFFRHSYGPFIASTADPLQRRFLASADAACRRPLSFLRMMHHCIMAPGFQPKERPANRPQGRRHWDWQRNWFARYAILAV